MGRPLFYAEKPKVEELQMDWLRSEDLKEEKDVTAPIAIVAEQGRLILGYTSWNTVKSMNWGTWQTDRPLLFC